MAYACKHPDSPYWTGVFRDENNQWRRKSTKQRDKSAALTLALEWERAAKMARDGVLTEVACREVLSGILKRATGETLRKVIMREFAQDWLKGKESNGQDGTATRYSGTVEKFLTSLGKKADLPIDAITPNDCQAFYESLVDDHLAPATIRVEMKAVIGLFNHARNMTFITTNPAKAVQLPKRIKQVKRQCFTPAAVQMLVDAAEKEWKTAILLGYFGGLRLGDAVSMHWDSEDSSIDLAGSRLKYKQHKTGAEIEIPLHPSLEAYLSKMAGDASGPLCPNLAAVPIGGRSGLSKQFLALMRQAGLSNNAVKTGGQRKLSRLSFHALRATFNSSLANQGVAEETRMKLTGHRSKAVNQRYTQTEIAPLIEAVNKVPALTV